MDHRLSDPHAPSTPLTGASAFEFEVPVTVWKADGAPEGKKRRIAGVVSTDSVDRQNERILQDGLNFDDFLNNGWFNDNHQQGTCDILGYPESVKRFKAGDPLPDGGRAKTDCTWVEGYLLTTKKADAVWELARSLAMTTRRLGYSVEGNIEAREGNDGNVIAKAKVRNIAVTNCPVNTDSRLEILARSLTVQNRLHQAAKSMSITDASGCAGPAKVGRLYNGEGAGQVLSKESLDGSKRKKRRSTNNRRLTRSEAVAYVKSLVPHASEALARALVASTKFQRGRGQ